jgi:hypothetical protein
MSRCIYYLDSRLYVESMTNELWKKTNNFFFNKGVGLDKGIDTTYIKTKVDIDTSTTLNSLLLISINQGSISRRLKELQNRKLTFYSFPLLFERFSSTFSPTVAAKAYRKKIIKMFVSLKS